VLTARLFGVLAVEVDGRRVAPPPGRRPRAVLAYLLLLPGLHHRSRLAGTFWPDFPETSARASLRSALWAVRAALEAAGGAVYLSGDRGRVGLDPDLPQEIDAVAFRRLVAAGDPASLERAVALATGPLLADLSDEWALAAQDEERDRLIGALEALARGAEEAGDLEAAIAWTRRALEEDRLREGLHRALMRRLAAAGEPAQALAAYRRAAALLSAQLGMAPAAETRALAAEIRGRSTAAAPPPAAPVPAEPPPPGLHGRERELGQLEPAWTAAAAGRGGVVAIGGEAGIGKSALANGLVRAAAGARSAAGAALAVGGSPPLAPWSELLRALVAATPAPAGGARWAGDLIRICPSIETAWGVAPTPPSASPEVERARLFEAVVAMVTLAARDAPLLLVLEDMHAADAASLALAAYVGRAMPGLRALLVVTRRQPGANADLDAALDALDRAGALVRDVRLGPLAADAVAAVVDEAAPGLEPEQAARVVAAAEGNPLLAREGARAAATGADAASGLRAGIRGQLAALPAPARALADAAAAAGRPLELGEAADLVGPDELGGAVEAAIAAGLLADAGGRRVGFAHALIGEACYAELSPAGRDAAHRRLAHALARRPRPVAAEVARHLRLAGEDEPARRYLVAAAEQARGVGALDAAAAFVTEAITLAGDDAGAEAELQLELADIEAWRGSRPGADAAFARARELIERRGDLPALALALVARGRALRTTLCYPREALAAYREALALLGRMPDDAPEARALALAGCAWAEAMAGDPARVEGLVAEARAVPEAAGDRTLVADLEAARASALIRLGRLEEAETPYELAAELAGRAGRSDLAHVYWTNVASAAACRGDFERALALAERAGASGSGGANLEASVHAARAHALARLGRTGEALAAADEEARVAARSGDVALEALADFDRGSILVAASEPAAAAERLERALASGTRRFSRPRALVLLATAQAALGAVAAAEQALARVPFEPVEAADMPETLVPMLERAQGLIAAAAGDFQRALARLAAAEAAWRRRIDRAGPGEFFAANVVDLGRPPVAGLVEPGVELGRVLADRAAILARAGRPDEAGAAAAEALALADAMAYDGYRSALEGLAAKEASDAGV
jgi:DNA-binding SARP family transcriptional activator/predicted ATPase